MAFLSIEEIREDGYRQVAADLVADDPSLRGDPKMLREVVRTSTDLGNAALGAKWLGEGLPAMVHQTGRDASVATLANRPFVNMKSFVLDCGSAAKRLITQLGHPSPDANPVEGARVRARSATQGPSSAGGQHLG